MKINEYKLHQTASLNRVPNSIQTDQKLCEIFGSEAFSISLSCDLDLEGQGHRLD